MAWALVTGASVGLGAEFARQIARSGTSVVLVSRDATALNAVAREIEAFGVEAEVLTADLSRRSDVARVARRVAADTRPVEVLVNNAGYGLRRGLLDSSAEDLDDMLEVMVRAVMALSRAAGRAMVSRGGGTIINVSSVAAVLSTGTYAAHKAWVSTFTEGLAAELRGTGVTATAVCPGLVRTEFHQRAALDLSALPSAAWLDSRSVVRSALRAAHRGRVLVTPSVRYGFVTSLARILPRTWIRRAARRGARPRATDGPKAGRASTLSP